MPTVAVTGSSGKLGRHVVAHLADHGYRVVALDRAPDPASRAAAFVRVDLTDTGQVLEALTGVDEVHDGLDAVVHLAAIPAPGLTTNGATFANNIAATHNVFSAARRAGIRSVVWASSETVLGLPFGDRSDHDASDQARRPTSRSTRSTRRARTARTRWSRRWRRRWRGSSAAGSPTLTMVGLRFSNVMDPARLRAVPRASTPTRGCAAGTCGATSTAATARRPSGSALEHCARGGGGVEVFVIANADTVMSRPSADLAAEVFPGVPVTRALGEHETLLSIEKARRVLGYAPAHSWRDGDDG